MAQAGWYPDTRRAGWQRYWDGAGWTEQWRPDDTDTELPPPEPTARSGGPAAGPPSPLPPPAGVPTSTAPPPPSGPPTGHPGAPMPPPRPPGTPRRALSTGATVAIVAGVLFVLFVAAGLAGAWDEPAGDDALASATEAVSGPTPAVASESATAAVGGSEPAATSEPDVGTPGPTATATVPAAGLAPARLVVDDGPGLEVLAFNELERSLADQLVDALEPAAWWPLVGELSVEEDLFVSDVRVSLDVFAHPDTAELFGQVCDDVVAALPDTDAGLAVHVYATQVSGAREEIDGSTSDWELYYARPGLATGDNLSDERCDVDDVDDSTVQRIEEYLADQDG